MRSFSLVLIVFFIVVVSSFAGCGYTNATQLPPDLRSIYIPTFINAIPLDSTFTYEAGLESRVTNAIINRFIFDGNLKVVDKIERADMVLLGEIIRYEQEPVGFKRDEGVEEYRLFIVTKLTMQRTSDDSVLTARGCGPKERR